jgi:hypothetical protein
MIQNVIGKLNQSWEKPCTGEPLLGRPGEGGVAPPSENLPPSGSVAAVASNPGGFTTPLPLPLLPVLASAVSFGSFIANSSSAAVGCVASLSCGAAPSKALPEPVSSGFRGAPEPWNCMQGVHRRCASSSGSSGSKQVDMAVANFSNTRLLCHTQCVRFAKSVCQETFCVPRREMHHAGEVL